MQHAFDHLHSIAIEVPLDFDKDVMIVERKDGMQYVKAKM